MTAGKAHIDVIIGDDDAVTPRYGLGYAQLVVEGREYKLCIEFEREAVRKLKQIEYAVKRMIKFLEGR